MRWWEPPDQEPAPTRSIAVLLHWVTIIVLLLTVLVTIGTVASLGLHFRHIAGNLAVCGMVVLAQLLLRRGRAVLAAHLFLGSLWALIVLWSLFVVGVRSAVAIAMSPSSQDMRTPGNHVGVA